MTDLETGQVAKVKHPAPYSAAVLEKIREVVGTWPGVQATLYDPFAGIGRIFELEEHFGGALECWGTEIEEEWVSEHPRHLHVDAFEYMALTRHDQRFDIVVTSPCVAQHELVLTADLRWIPAGDVRVGDKLMAFDEFSPFIKANGAKARRKWRIATVTQSYGAKKECVRVHLANGESIDCTTDHPWLAERYAIGTKNGPEWVEARHMKGMHVLKQLEPWRTSTSFDAGWLAGIFDGEGSLSFGTHGAPKLLVCQRPGEVQDRIEHVMRALGYKHNVIQRSDSDVLNTYITGGFPEILRALGELRPVRLLPKLGTLDVASRTIEPWRVKVEEVEYLGMRDIQGIETSTGTYITAGYLHHNTYGNRMADHHDAQDGSKRITYRHYLGRPLDDNNSGRLQWGKKYRDFHERAWAAVHGVLKPGGWFLLNISDHIRAWEQVPVSKWHMQTCEELGFEVVAAHKIETPRMKFGANGSRRVDNEWLIHMAKAA